MARPDPENLARIRRKAAANSVAANARKRGLEQPLVPYPVTHDHEYSADELEYLGAMAAYQKRTGRRFPTLTECLAVARELGYRKP